MHIKMYRIVSNRAYFAVVAAASRPVAACWRQ